MASVVADTHAIVWMLEADPRLSSAARTALTAAVTAGVRIHVSAVSLVKIIYLVEKGRIPRPAWERLAGLIVEADSFLNVVSLDAEVARTVERVPARDIPDMPDRIIAATALLLGLPLVTCDRRIAASVRTIW